MKIGLLICTYNRPDYLTRCLESIKRTRLPEPLQILIVDDGSTDQDTLNLIKDFSIKGVPTEIMIKKERMSIKDSMLRGSDHLFYLGCEIVTNLDSDAIISNDFFEKLFRLKERYYSHIITGFNCLTKNNDGSDRHKVIMNGNGFNLKRTVGGINLMYDKDQYDVWIRPALLKSMEQNLNWDYISCLNSMQDKFEIVCAVPSVVQHVGIKSSMGHATQERPDIADDFKPVRLDDVTLIAVDDNVDAIIEAANVSCKDIDFASVKLLSHSHSKDKRVVPIRKLGSKKEYSIFMMKEIVNYIDTPFFVTIQADGYIVNGKAWNDEWYEYDYIGAPWHWYKDGHNVGNGAMSFRSKTLHEVLKNDDYIIPTNDHLITECQEDHNIARIYRKYLEDRYQISFAPIEVAERFSIEAWNVPYPQNKYSGQFGFHGKSVVF